MTDPQAPIGSLTFKEMQAYMAQHYPEMLNGRISKFAPKLTFVERCEVLALSKAKLDRRVISAAYGINRATLAYVVNDTSPHYKDVRKEYKELSHERFLARYITPPVMERYTVALKDNTTAYSDDELRRASANGEAPDQNFANKAATKNAGYIYFTELNSAKVVKGNVVWADKPGPDPQDFSAVPPDRSAGWYVQVEEWGADYYGSAHHSKTSTSAKNGLLTDNMLKEVEA